MADNWLVNTIPPTPGIHWVSIHRCTVILSYVSDVA